MKRCSSQVSFRQDDITSNWIAVRFQSVRKKFMSSLRELSAKDQTTYNVNSIISLLMGMNIRFRKDAVSLALSPVRTKICKSDKDKVWEILFYSTRHEVFPRENGSDRRVRGIVWSHARMRSVLSRLERQRRETCTRRPLCRDTSTRRRQVCQILMVERNRFCQYLASWSYPWR